MNWTTSIVFYLFVGAAVGGALMLRHGAGPGDGRGWHAALAVLFWPLYLPVLLQWMPPSGGSESHESESPLPSALDGELAQAVAQVEAELDLALGSLDCWTDAPLFCERDRFAELRSAWRQQATRISELDRLLAQPTFLSDGALPASLTAVAARLGASEISRRENIARLQALRQRLVDDLFGTLAKVRELATRIHLARYTGAPAARAEELVEQIAAAVAGLVEVVDWRE